MYSPLHSITIKLILLLSSMMIKLTIDIPKFVWFVNAKILG